MTDFSTVVVHQNEPSLERALASIRRQTLLPREVILADPETAPVDRAINDAARRVRTPYFIQVDADMVLDRDCFARLRGAAPEIPGVVAGFLRDPILGRINAVKLFPTDAFDGEGMPGTISPDSDLQMRLRLNGRCQLSVLKFRGPRDLWHTLGEHRPGYTAALAFGRFFVQGERLLYRGQLKGAWLLFQRLQKSDHPSALSAQIGMANGIFSGRREGIRLRPAENPLYPKLEIFLGRQGSPLSLPELTVEENRPQCFATFHDRGRHLQRKGVASDLERDLKGLSPSNTLPRWFGILGLFRGLLDPTDDGTAGLDEGSALLDKLQAPSLRKSYWEMAESG